MEHGKRQDLQRIVAHLGFPESELLMGLWDTMVTVPEAAWLARLPATAAELAERLDADPVAVADGLQSLYERGLVLIEADAAQGPRYAADDNPGRLMDLVLFDRRYLAWYGEPFLDAWRTFYNEELVHVYEHPDPDTRPFRVVPVRESVQDSRTVLPHEQVAAMVKKARRISVELCPCRTRERACDNPLETCLAFDEVADYMIARGVGREIDATDALTLLTQCEQAGLVHLTENAEHPLVLCNCCPCCCVFLRAMTIHGKQDVIDSSRYRALVDEERCLACGLCVSRCHLSAIVQEQGKPARVLAHSCFGCGLCASSCPAYAITLVEIRTAQPLPHTESGFGSMLPVSDE